MYINKSIELYYMVNLKKQQKKTNIQIAILIKNQTSHKLNISCKFYVTLCLLITQAILCIRKSHLLGKIIKKKN